MMPASAATPPAAEPTSAVGPAPSADATLRAGVASGLRWGTLNQVVQQATRLLVQVVLTRLLAPEAFGLLALAFVVVNFGALLTGLGFSQALIQRRHLTSALVDAVFVGSALLGIAIGVGIYTGAATLATLLGDAELAPVLRVLSVVFVFQGVEGVPNTMLRRALLFRPYVLSSTIGAVVGGTTGIVLGVAGAGVWALVGFALAEAVVATVLAWAYAIRAGVWRPRATWDLRPLRGVLGYSGAVTGNRLLFYGSRNVDNLIVGRVLGTVALGYYGLAYRVMLFPIQRITDVLGSVTLPTFAALQHDPARVNAAYLRAVKYLAAIIVPATIGVAVTAHHLVPVVFGPQWEAAVVPLRILALSGPAIALVRLTGNLWEAIGRAGITLGLSAIALLLLIPGFALGVHFGVPGVSVAYTVTIYAGLVPALFTLRTTCGITVGRQLRNVLAVAVATAAMALAAVAVDVLLAPADSHGLRLVAMAAAGATVYLVALHHLDRGLLRDAWRLLRTKGA